MTTLLQKIPLSVAVVEDSSAAAAPAAVSVGARRKRAGTSVAVHIPTDLLSRPKLVSLATRLKMTPTQQAAYTQAVIAESGGDVSMVSTSYATADRCRRKVVSEIAVKVRKNWTPPRLCTLHWDSKLTSTLKNHRVNEECMTVIIGDSTQMKLLGVPSYTEATAKSYGSIIADLTVTLIDEWQCTDRIVNMAFDTTSSNTGHLSAACIAIQNKLGRAILWSGCRHHIGEVILSHVFEDLKIEASKSPDVMLFTRFRSNWDLVLHGSIQTAPFSPSDHSPEVQELLAAMKSEFVARAKEAVQYVRDDYKEFVQLAFIYLGFVGDDDQ